MSSDAALWTGSRSYHTLSGPVQGLVGLHLNTMALCQTYLLFSEICFSILMRAASVQHYHFTRILLSLHQPVTTLQGHSTVDRLRRYRNISEEVDHHAREICGIALANSPWAVRIHMLQPLYLSGLCLEHRKERETILELLRGIEAELGWTTSHRVDRLQADWSRIDYCFAIL